ncbi:hypothetical protein [Brachybacterium sp. YJGR34]|uniref:hypothetical protein n=1 Tax=Brachybacterium sp. YJGR34 TaxID=2059911 RepID=UPI000E0BEFD1|nr:hypothetical protein [Brachybacterium sp. YJGR34]
MTNEQGSLWERPAPRGDGPIATAVRAEIERKIADGIMDGDQYAGQIAQALTLAAEVDATVGVGRPSGRAQIHDVLHRLLFDLPQPERIGSSSELDRALEMIMQQDGAG